jgi:hypothetical protein
LSDTSLDRDSIVVDFDIQKHGYMIFWTRGESVSSANVITIAYPSIIVIVVRVHYPHHLTNANFNGANLGQLMVRNDRNTQIDLHLDDLKSLA